MSNLRGDGDGRGEARRGKSSLQHTQARIPHTTQANTKQAGRKYLFSKTSFFPPSPCVRPIVLPFPSPQPTAAGGSLLSSFLHISPHSAIAMSIFGLLEGAPLVGIASILRTTSRDSAFNSRPKTTCFPSSQSALAVVMKN